MKLTVFNGSPRGRTSNTGILLKHFLLGWEETPGNSVEIFFLNTESDRQSARVAFGKAAAGSGKLVLLAFPLYTDAMPGIVKEFIEMLAEYKGRPGNPAIAFMIHSGFGEGSHTKYLPLYLEKLCRRLGSEYLGTIRKGGTEGIRTQPAFLSGPIFALLKELGTGFGKTLKLDEALLKTLAGRDRAKHLELYLTERLAEHLFWNPQLKKNNAFETRLARPYLSKAY